MRIEIELLGTINDETFGLRKNCRGGVFHSRSINW